MLSLRKIDYNIRNVYFHTISLLFIRGIYNTCSKRTQLLVRISNDVLQNVLAKMDSIETQ